MAKYFFTAEASSSAAEVSERTVGQKRSALEVSLPRLSRQSSVPLSQEESSDFQRPALKRQSSQPSTLEEKRKLQVSPAGVQGFSFFS